MPKITAQKEAFLVAHSQFHLWPAFQHRALSRTADSRRDRFRSEWFLCIKGRISYHVVTLW